MTPSAVTPGSITDHIKPLDHKRKRALHESSNPTTAQDNSMQNNVYFYYISSQGSIRQVFSPAQIRLKGDFKPIILNQSQTPETSQINRVQKVSLDYINTLPTSMRNEGYYITVISVGKNDFLITAIGQDVRSN